MKRFRDEGQQLGAAQTETETMAHPGECRHFGHAKVTTTHRDPGFGGPIPVTVGSFETKVNPHEDFGCIPCEGRIPLWGAGGICICMYIYT